MTEKLSYTLADLARLIVEKLADKPDAYATSIGEWTPDNVFGDPLKQFEALLRVDVGDWRKLLAEHEQRIAELEKDALRFRFSQAQEYAGYKHQCRQWEVPCMSLDEYREINSAATDAAMLKAQQQASGA